MRKIILALLIADIIALMVFIGFIFFAHDEQIETEQIIYEIPEEPEVVEVVQEEVKAERETVWIQGEIIDDISCEQLYDIDTFEKLGVVKYNGYRYTWYSQRVLPGGGLKIEGRHVEDRLVKDIDGYVCVASMEFEKGAIVDTPLGIKGKVYDYCETPGTIDIYTDF